jgi:hypothetical protein
MAGALLAEPGSAGEARVPARGDGLRSARHCSILGVMSMQNTPRVIRLFAGSDGQSHFEEVAPDLEPRGDQSAVAELARCEIGHVIAWQRPRDRSEKPVLCIPSGSKMRMRNSSSRGCPATRASRTPRTSEPTLYCQRSRVRVSSGPPARGRRTSCCCRPHGVCGSSPPVGVSTRS